MGKTNHRINKDRTEKLGEPEAHKQRRGAKQKVSLLVDYYEDAELLYDEFMESQEFETFEKIRRRHG